MGFFHLVTRKMTNQSQIKDNEFEQILNLKNYSIYILNNKIHTLFKFIKNSYNSLLSIKDKEDIYKFIINYTSVCNLLINDIGINITLFEKFDPFKKAYNTNNNNYIATNSLNFLMRIDKNDLTNDESFFLNKIIKYMNLCVKYNKKIYKNILSSNDNYLYIHNKYKSIDAFKQMYLSNFVSNILSSLLKTMTNDQLNEIVCKLFANNDYPIILTRLVTNSLYFRFNDDNKKVISKKILDLMEKDEYFTQYPKSNKYTYMSEYYYILKYLKGGLEHFNKMIDYGKKLPLSCISAENFVKSERISYYKCIASFINSGYRNDKNVDNNDILKILYDTIYNEMISNITETNIISEICKKHLDNTYTDKFKVKFKTIQMLK